MYHSLSLNGTWEMAYSQDAYLGTDNPWTQGHPVVNAVPGYWEDMKDAFLPAPFYGRLKINPEFTAQSYPMSGNPPDMALPNIAGNFFYRRTFSCDAPDRPAEICFEGVQNCASVWFNDVFLGRHEGYSTPFCFAIPQNVLRAGENAVVISVSNIGLTGYGGEPVLGLTNRAANLYTGGITGDVELRFYPGTLRTARILISGDCRRADVRVTLSQNAEFDWTVFDGSEKLLGGSARGDFSFDTHALACWSPENPKLYTLRLTCGADVQEYTFGVRRLTAQGVHLRLNGKPVYLRGICEHCYYPDTVHPNHDIDFYRDVIRRIKELGFNFVRFHTHIPAREYMQAADELGILLEVESPNNTSFAEWQQIVEFCSAHTSVVMYSCGNELLMDDDFIAHQRSCARVVHAHTDSLFSPMSALRGLEYYWNEENIAQELLPQPFLHHPRRFQLVGQFSDVYNSYTQNRTSYCSLQADPQQLDSWSSVYNKPRLSHEICIQGCYPDLSLERRYAGKRIGQTDMFASIRRHLQAKGLLEKAPLYFRNSSQWQRRLRKHNFEAVRLCRNLAGFDFLGPIDTHWHTFGYDVGMMNEFYELKPGETVRNVRMYNSETVLLTDLGTDFNFFAGDALRCGIYISHYGGDDLCNASLSLRLTLDGELIHSCKKICGSIKAGEVTQLLELNVELAQCSKPGEVKLQVALEAGDTYAENEWELYVFPHEEPVGQGNLLVTPGMGLEELISVLKDGKNVLILGGEPFVTLPTSFQMALAGRTSGNLATVITDHPALENLPHRGFCGWQFRRLLEDGKAVCFETDAVAFDPIVEVVSTHKFAIRQGALFEFAALKGKLLVCSFRFEPSDPAACWLKNGLIRYASGSGFAPVHEISEEQLRALAQCTVTETAANKNFAFNPNDKAANRKKK